MKLIPFDGEIDAPVNGLVPFDGEIDSVVADGGAGRGTSAASDPRRLDSIEGQARAGLLRDESKVNEPDPSTLTAEQHRARYTRGSAPIASGSSVLERPLTVEQRVEAALRKDVEALPPDMRIGALRKIGDGDDLQASIARSMVDKEVSRTVLRDADPTNAKLLEAMPSGQKGGRGALDKPDEKLAIPSDVPSSVDDWKLAPRDVATKNLAADQALGENRSNVVAAGEDVAAEARSQELSEKSRRQQLAREHPYVAALTSGSAQAMSGIANIPTVLADFLNQTVTNPVLNLAGLPSLARAPMAPGTEYLAKAQSQYAPEMLRTDVEDAWKQGRMGEWAAANLAAFTPQAVQLVAAGQAKALENSVLILMGLQQAGSSYASGDDSRIAMGKGVIEGLSEKIPFHVADKVVEAIKVLPPKAKADVGRYLAAQIVRAGAVMASSHLVEGAEEGISQFGQNALDRYVAGKNASLTDGVLNAAAVGAVAGGAFGVPRAARGWREAQHSGAAGEALADALNGGQFTQSGIDADVAARVGYGNTVYAPGSQMGQFVEARLADIAGKRNAAQAKVDRVDAIKRTAAEAAKEQGQQAVADIGAQTTVEGAISATQRAVNIDSNSLLNEALASAGINRDEMDAHQAQAKADVMQADQDAAWLVAEATKPAQQATEAADQQVATNAPAKVWYGRRGDGYQTSEDAGRALKERQRLSRGLEWAVEQTPDGRFFLAGREIGNARSGQAQGGQLLQGQTGVQPAGRIAVEQTAPAQLDRATVAQQQSDVEVLREGLEADKPGSAANLRYAGDGGVSAHPGRSPAVESAIQDINDVGDITQKAFGWRPSAIGGLNGFGVQYKGRLFVDANELAKSSKGGNTTRALVISTIGHEGSHQLEKSNDPADRAAHQKLRQVILSMAKDGVVERRHETENKAAGREVGRAYAENEVVADVNGGLWLDPEFWSRLYDLDNGSTMRRVAYKVMEAATKLIKATKGSRLDPARFVKDVDAVREVAAQVWAEKAQRNSKGQQPLFDEKRVANEGSISRSASSDEVLGQSNFEVAPDPGDAALSGRWNNLPLRKKLRISREVADVVVPQVLELSDSAGSIVEQIGSYLNDTNPSFALQLTRGDLNAVSGMLGYVLSQDSMMNLSAREFAGSEKVGAVVVHIGALPFGEVKAVYDEIRALIPDVGGQSFAGGWMTILNYSDTPTPELGSRIAELLHGRYPATTKEVYSTFPQKESYDYGSKENDSRGGGKLGQELRRRLGDLRSEASKLINERIDSTSFSRRDEQQNAQDGVEDGRRPDWGGSDGRQSERTSGGRIGGVDSGAGAAPRYGKPIEHSTSVVGYHYSKQPRERLDGSYYGTGLKGAERERLAGPENNDIASRIFFYVDGGKGIRPESGVGGYAHHVRLDNLYDVSEDKLGIVGRNPGANNWERAVVKAGFDGYVIRDKNQSQHYAVLIGKKHRSVPVGKADAPIAKNLVARTMPEEQKARTVRKGDMLVRNPVGKEMMEVIRAMPDIGRVAPSIKLEWGAVHVAASEAATVNAMMRERGSTFAFDEGLSRSQNFDDFDELGGFNVDRQLSDMDDVEAKEMSIEDFERMVQEELRSEQNVVKAQTMPSAEAIRDAGIMAESAFDTDDLFTHDKNGRLNGFNWLGDVRVDLNPRSNGSYSLEVFESSSGGYTFMKTTNEASVKALVRQQAAASVLRRQGFDLLDAYRKGTSMKLSAQWKQIASKEGAIRSPMPKTDSTDFEVVAGEMGLFDGYEMSHYGNGIDFVSPSGRRNVVGIERNGYSDRFSICTIDLKGTDMGADVYAVMAVVAKNGGKKFLADTALSSINTYRRTEQAMSFALKSSDTGVLLPGQQNRVYGYNEHPQTQQDHDENLARLALAGLRNAQEVFPEVRRLRYDAAQDRFTDSRGNDAEDKVRQALNDPVARDFGLGRSTIARAVITSQIISGDTASLDVNRFAKAVSYSLADVELDKPVGEGWGDEGGLQALNPNLRRFIAGSKIVNEDGTPKMMFHGTAQNIHAFRAKQAGAIFVTGSPSFAEDFASMSGAWMRAHMDQVLTSEQIEQVRKDAIKAVMADKSRSLTERKALRRQIELGDETGAAKDAIDEAAGNYMPSQDNIIPVFVRAVSPFDYRSQSDVDDVVFTLMDGRDGSIELTLGGEKQTYGEGEIRKALLRGEWSIIEAPEVQDVIRNQLGHDSFYVTEHGQRNLAVYDPGSIKSVFNSGSWNREDDRLSFSRIAGDNQGPLFKNQFVVPEVDPVFANGDVAQMPALLFGRDGIKRSFPSMPVRISVGQHGTDGAPMFGLQHRIDNANIGRSYKVPAIDWPMGAGEVERAARDVTLGLLESKTAYADSSPTRVYLYAPGLDVLTVLVKSTDSSGKPYWSVITSHPITRERANMRFKAPTSVRVGLPLPNTGPQQTSDSYHGILKKLREPDLSHVSSESLIIDEDGLIFKQAVAPTSTVTVVNKPKRELARDPVTGKIILNKNKVGSSLADSGISLSRTIGQNYELPAENWRLAARRLGQDYFLRAMVVQNAVAEQGGTVDEPTNFYLAEELSHGRRGALAKDFADDTIAPLMEKAVRLNVDLEELALYAYAKHAPERNAKIARKNSRFPDGGSGMTNADAAAIIAKVKNEGREQAFEDLHGDLMGIAAANRRVMLDEDLITQDEYDRLENDSQFYIPLRGFEKVNDEGEVKGRSAGKGINVRGPETLRALGRASRAGQLIENLIVDHLRTIDRAERNQVGKVFLNFVLQNPDPGLWEVDASRTRQALNRQTGRVQQHTSIDKGEDTVAVKVKGREIYIKIHDPLLLRALRKAHKDETGDTERLLMRTAGLYTSLLRNTLTRYNPEFALTNALRDFGFGAAAMVDVLGEKGAAKFTAHYAGAIAASHRNERNTLDPQQREWDRYFTEFKMAGGTTSGFYVKNLDEIGRDIREMMLMAGARPTGFTEAALNSVPARAVKSAGRVLEWAGSVSENAARVASFRTAREMGKSPSEAASIAKNLTTNFDRKGELGQLVNSFYVFYNAAVQGSHRLLKMAQNPKMLAYAAGFGATGVMLALASAGLGGDDPDDGIAYWDKIPEYDKERNLIIMLPPGEQMEGAERVGTRGQYIKIPLQYGLNLPVAFGYVIADLIRNRQDKTRGMEPLKAGVTLASYLAGAFNPFGGSVDLSSGSSVAQAVLPSMGDAVVQFSTGTNSFGREVAPFKNPFDTKPDSENYNLRQAGSVSLKIARWLNSLSGGSQAESGAIDISAGTVDNLIRNLTGGTGQFINDSVNLAWKSVDRATGGDPDLFARDIPLGRRVYGQLGGDVDQGLFYENRRKAQEAAGVVKRSGELGIEPKAKDAVLTHLNGPANQITRQLSQIRREMIRVTEDDSLSQSEKTSRLRELRAARDQITANYNRAFAETMRDFFADESIN